MIFGHAALAFGVKRWRPAIPLWVLLGATYFADGSQVWLETFHWPPWNSFYAHAITTLLVVAILGGGLYAIIAHSARDGALIGALVLSHWALDFITGVKPTWVGGPVVGLCVYRHHALDFVIESVFILAVWMWARRVDRRDVFGDWRLYAALIACQGIADIVGALMHGGACLVTRAVIGG